MKKRLLSLLLVFVMVLGMLPVTAFADTVPVSVTANDSAVTVSYQGNFSDTQWGFDSIPVYCAQVSEDAAISITCGGDAEAIYRPGDGYLGYLSELQGMTKDSLQSYFTTAASYGLTTTNNVAYIEILDYYYGSIYGVLIELVPAAPVSTGPVSVTADGSAVSVTTQGNFPNKMYSGSSQIPVYYAKAAETATLDITYGAEYSALDTAYLFSIDASELVGVTKTGLEGYLTTASDYGLDTANSVAYLEFANGWDPGFGLLIELEPASDGGDSDSTTSEKLTGITGVGSSTDTTENLDVSYAFDGDDSTYWATAAGGSLEDSYLIADLGGTCTINKVEYTKRYASSAEYNCTGNLLNYVIEVSTDGETWTEAAKGETIDGTTVIEFAPVQAAYVRLTSTSSYHWDSTKLNTVMCVAELAVFKTGSGDSDTPAPATYTVTLPSGEGYSAAASGESASPVEAGGSYSFTVTVAEGYDGTNMAVKANDTELTDVDGVYTIENISADQVIIVTGVEKKAVSLVSVTAGGVACELTVSTFQSSVSGNKTEIPVYMTSADEGAAIVINKGANGDGGSGSYRRAWKYGASSGNWDEATYPISVGSGYAVNDTAKEKFGLTTTNTVYYVEVGAYSDGTPLYGVLVEVIPEAVEPAATYTVTLPSGEGYSAAASGESASPVEAGGSFSFTVAVIYGYDGTNMVVKANDTVLTAADGVYTIENITADQTVTVTGITKAVQTDYSDYITVSVEKYDADGNCTFLLEPTRNAYDQYKNKYVIDALKLAVGGSQYSDKVGYSSTYADGVSTYAITKVYDETQSDSYLDNGDLEGCKWQVLVDNAPWEGSYYNKDYALTGGEVLRCIYTNEAVEDVAGGVSKDALIQLAADVSDEIKTTQAYKDALDTIVSDTASEEDVQNAITALQNAMVVNAVSVEITAGERVDLKVNQEMTLQAAILPANATDVPVWSTSDSEIVSVDTASGKITGVSAGEATVTVTCGSATDTITVNVEAVKAESVTITNGDVSVEARFSVQLAAEVTPEGSTELVEWSVADESIATVDANGKLTGVSAGETTVTATAGSVSASVTVTVTETTSTYVYFRYSDGSVQEMKDDSFTLTVLDEGYFVVGNTTAAATWSCSEYVSAGGEEMQYNYWIGSDGKYQPHGAKEMTANVNAGGYYKTFTIKTVPSGISEIKACIGDAEKNAENPYEVTGMANAVVAVYGLNEAGEWVYIPTQAVNITSSDTNIARFLGNQMSLIHEGSADITISMLDNSEVSTSFQAICNTIQVTAIDVHVPETFYIDKWDSMGSVFVGIYKGYENPDTQYYVNYTPSNATNQDLIWEDLTPEIAVYDEGWSTGIVPKKAGTAKFKVTSVSNPQVSQEVSIRFAYKTPLESAVSAQESYEMAVGDSIDPGLTFTPSNATETRFNWTYSQDGIVQVKETVTSAGYARVVSRKIIALANGTVTVTGTPIDDTAGCKTVVFTVTVGGSGETETIDYLKMAKDDIAHGLEYLQGQDQTFYGNEWTIFSNLRAGGALDSQLQIVYLKSVADELKSGASKQPTDYARLVLTLPLLGADPENFEGIDLVEKLYNAALDNQTSNQICWTLLALDSRNYEIPEDAQWSRDKLIEKILTFQTSDGGFGLTDSNGAGGVDMTGMILQSLAPYYNSNAEVKTAVDKALDFLKDQTTENVGYIEGGAENACTAAQVLTALAALNIDPTDPANGFTLGTKNLVTNLHTFLKDSGFAYLLGGETNLMGTQQTVYALEAYRRYAEGENALYDLTDVELSGDDDGTKDELAEERAQALASLIAEYNKLSGDDYSEEGWAEVEAAYEEGKTAINAAATSEAISEALSAAIEKMKNVETKELEKVTVAVTMELFTLDLGYIIEPVLVEVNENEKVSVIITDLLREKYPDMEQPWTMTGTVESGFYLASVYAGDSIDSEYTDDNGYIGEFDNGNQSGWMYSVDHVFPNVGASDRKITGNEVIRWQYTCTGYGADLGQSGFGSDEVAVVADKDDLTWKVAEINTAGQQDAYGIAYTNAVDVLKNHTSTQDEVDAALAALLAAPENLSAAAAVDAKIAAIGEVTLDSEAAIAAAREAYNALTGDQKALVENLEALEAAEAKLAELKAASKLPFTDVPESDWFYDEVKYVFENGLMHGTSATIFEPGTATTRGMFVTVLYRLEGEPTVYGDCEFTDVASGSWYEDAIIWGAANGIVNGYGETFGPDDSITREQMVAILYRYADFKGYDTDTRADLSGYTDAETVSDWSEEAMSWAVAEGLIKGRTASTLSPRGTANRAEIATILKRFIEKH